MWLGFSEPWLVLLVPLGCVGAAAGPDQVSDDGTMMAHDLHWKSTSLMCTVKSAWMFTLVCIVQCHSTVRSQAVAVKLHEPSRCGRFMMICLMTGPVSGGGVSSWVWATLACSSACCAAGVRHTTQCHCSSLPRCIVQCQVLEAFTVHACMLEAFTVTAC